MGNSEVGNIYPRMSCRNKGSHGAQTFTNLGRPMLANKPLRVGEKHVTDFLNVLSDDDSLIWDFCLPELRDNTFL